ncbi:outer membrane protein C [Salmonella enterica subsp. enterica serovar Typhimurium str. DT104]|nr:outer membrane protein C [Salmonella enterica subsp. enterica serovar Typhimurium str. DT104]
MKLKLVAVAVTSLLAAGVVNAAEVYITKTAINWICTVKFTLSIISLMITEVMVTKLTRVWALKAKRRSTIS